MYKLPSNWHQVTVSQYYELVESEKQQWDSNIDKMIEQISILLDIGSDELDLDTDELFDLYSNLKWLNNNIATSYSSKIGDFHIKKWNDLTLGEFIDIENAVMSNPYNNIHILCAIIYRRTKNDEWGNIELEPYKYDIFDRSNNFLDIPITQVYGLLSSYMEFRESFMKTYDSLFGDSSINDKSLDIEEEQELTGPELAARKKELNKERSLSKWSWESMIWNLSNQDITKFESIFNTSLILTFNVLSMKMVIDAK